MILILIRSSKFSNLCPHILNAYVGGCYSYSTFHEKENVSKRRILYTNFFSLSSKKRINEVFLYPNVPLQSRIFRKCKHYMKRYNAASLSLMFKPLQSFKKSYFICILAIIPRILR